MKRIGLLAVGFIAAMVLISNLGPLIGLAVSLLVLYFILKQFLKSNSTVSKIGWSIIGIIILLVASSNAPAIIAVGATIVLYLVYKNWDKKNETFYEEKDPFANFEKQWTELKNN